MQLLHMNGKQGNFLGLMWLVVSFEGLTSMNSHDYKLQVCNEITGAFLGNRCSGCEKVKSIASGRF